MSTITWEMLTEEEKGQAQGRGYLVICDSRNNDEGDVPHTLRADIFLISHFLRAAVEPTEKGDEA